MIGAYFMFYNRVGNHEVHQAMSELIAQMIHSVPRNNGPILLFRCGQTPPNALERASILEVHNVSLAAKAILAYPEMEGKTPQTRAKQAFKEAFGRPADTKNRILEAEALSSIVMLSGG